jgi:hypothetical protein
MDIINHESCQKKRLLSKKFEKVHVKDNLNQFNFNNEFHHKYKNNNHNDNMNIVNVKNNNNENNCNMEKINFNISCVNMNKNNLNDNVYKDDSFLNIYDNCNQISSQGSQESEDLNNNVKVEKELFEIQKFEKPKIEKYNLKTTNTCNQLENLKPVKNYKISNEMQNKNYNCNVSTINYEKSNVFIEKENNVNYREYTKHNKNFNSSLISNNSSGDEDDINLESNVNNNEKNNKSLSRNKKYFNFVKLQRLKLLV